MAEAEKKPEPAPLEIQGVQEDQYRAWRRHPVTKLFHRYLADFADALRRDHMARWEEGADDEATEKEALGRVRALTEVKDLEFAHIALFYEDASIEEDQGETNGSEQGT